MLQIFINDFKGIIRDKSLVFFTILFPSFMVFLLGNLLSSADYAEQPIDPITIQYVVETKDPIGVAAVEEFFKHVKDVNQFTAEKVNDINDAKGLVGKNGITAAVLFEQPLDVQIYTGSEGVQNRAVRSLMTAFARQSGAVASVLSVAPQNLEKVEAGASEETYVKEKDLGVNRSMLDYYAVTMAVMILFMGGMGGAVTIQEERRDRTLTRLLISPKRRTAIYVQKVLGGIPQVIAQIAVVMLCSMLLFDAHYAAAWQHNLLLFAMFFAVGLTAIAIFAIVGIVMKANAMLAIMPVIWVLLFFSGTFSKEVYIEGVTNHTPIYYVQSAAFDLTVFGHTEKAVTIMLVSALLFCAALTVGALLFTRKEVTA